MTIRSASGTYALEKIIFYPAGILFSYYIPLPPSVNFLTPGRRRYVKSYNRGRRHGQPVTLFDPPGVKKLTEGAK